MTVLTQLVAELNAGKLKIVDLTQPLGPETPVIGLPPMFASSPGVTMDVISHFDAKGPAWYWNVIHMGEHTGTHFDAPVHWITGKDLPDNRCDTIPARRFVGPACVIDVSADVAKNPDFLLTPERIATWEKAHGKIPAGAWVLLRTDWSKRTDAKSFLNVGADGPAQPGLSQERVGAPGARPRRSRRRRRDGRNRRRAGGDVRPAVPQPRDDAWGGEVRAREPAQPRSAAGDGRGRDRRAAQDREWKREPRSRAGDRAGGSAMTMKNW